MAELNRIDIIASEDRRLRKSLGKLQHDKDELIMAVWNMTPNELYDYSEGDIMEDTLKEIKRCNRIVSINT